MKKALAVLVLGVVTGCPTPKQPALDAGPRQAALKPLEPLERVRVEADAADEDPLYLVVPVPPVGPPVPAGLTSLRFTDETPMVNGAPLDFATTPGPFLLEPGDTYFAQVFDFFSKADNAGAEVWLKHPDAPIAFQLHLRDEPAFQVWLDEPVPGKLRVIHRTDGFELQTNLGKLPGGDPKGPTVPVRGGRLDLKTFQRGLEQIAAKFKVAPDYCYLPSYGMELAQTARAMAANYSTPESAFFPETCLVFHRPASDAGH
jgi:hypothetical protein